MDAAGTWWRALPPRVATIARWLAFVVMSWLLLRPVLVTTISGDDFLNPFYVFDDYGPSPFGMFARVSRDLTRAGHFNHVGQNVGAIAYVSWAYLIGWGVRYSLVYAVTKLVVFVVVAIAAARLLRRLSSFAGLAISLWRSRTLVAAGLFLTVQIHVAWSSDPVASFPLSGYASVAFGLVALDACIVALDRRDRRSVLVGAAALCLAIQYYEINVAVVPALLPFCWIAAQRARAGGWLRSLTIRLVLLIGPATAMTLVLQVVAAGANRTYTGTDVAVGNGTVRTFVRAMLGSVPAAAWPRAHEWLGRSFHVTSGAVVTACAGALVVVALTRRRTISGPSAARTRRVALAATCPAILWVVATAIQATTEKVRAETIGVGFVYNYYAYGSVAVVLVGLLLWTGVSVPWRTRLRPVLVGLAIAFVAMQAVVNDDVRTEFAIALAVNDDLVAAASDAPSAAVRCALLQRWLATPYFLDYYRADMSSGLDAVYEHFHHEPFCGDPG